MKHTSGLLCACALALAALATAELAAQVDISGGWRITPRNEDGSGMTGDGAGIPLTEGSKARRNSWSPEDFDVAEWVCRPHPWDFSLTGVFGQLRIWPDIDQPTQKVVAIHGHVNMMEQESTIWMDGRPHPPAAANHSWSGFTTGEWDGDVLVTTTTHLKESYIRRSGIMRSDQAVERTRWRRIGDYLQATVILYDPVYLTEPFVQSTMMWVYDPTAVMAPYPCEEATETAVPRGSTPNFLPGKSPLPSLNPDVTDRFGTPYEARLGGADTMYPEYIARMRTFKRPVSKAPPGSTETERAEDPRF